MLDALVRGVLAGYGIAIPVGAIAVLIVGVAMRCGFTVVYFTSMVIGSGAGQAPTLAEAAVLGGGAFVTSLSWETLLAGVGRMVKAPAFKQVPVVYRNCRQLDDRRPCRPHHLHVRRHNRLRSLLPSIKGAGIRCVLPPVAVIGVSGNEW